MRSSEQKQAGAAAMSQKSEFLWLNGEILAWDKANIHITAVGNLGTAATVFEGIRAYWNEERQALIVFKLKDHMKRLGESMKLQRMNRPFSQEQLEQAVVDLLKANALRGDTYISPRAFFDPLGTWSLTENPESVQVLITGWLRPSQLAGGEPVHVCVSSWTRIADNIVPPRVKCVSNYQNSRLAAWEAHLNGYDNAILLDGRGKVSEATAACLFIVRDGVAITPSKTSGILESITRKTLLELFSKELGVPTEERDVDRTELYVADEAFFCGTGGGEVTPLASIDRYQLGSGSPGPLTEAIRGLYHDVVRGRHSKYKDWLTEVQN